MISNEHICQISKETEYDCLLRSPRTIDGKNYDAILATASKNGEIGVFCHSMRFPMSDWTESEAKSFLKSMDSVAFKAAETPNEDPELPKDNEDPELPKDNEDPELPKDNEDPELPKDVNSK